MAATAPASGSVDLAAARVADLHALYGESVYRYCRKRLRSHEDAEDAAQIVFMNAHRALAQGVEPRSESAWLFKIAENVVLYRHRTSLRRAQNEFPADTAELHEIRQPVPDMHGVAREIAQALSKVPPSQQRAFVLREWQGLPYQTIAAELSVSVEAATALVVRARNTISRELEKPSRLSRFGSLVAWLLTPVERVISSGVVLKTAAGVATVVIGVPTAETVLERHAAQAGVPISVANAKIRGASHRATGVRSTAVTTPASRSASAAPAVGGARVHVARVADVSGPIEGATPSVSAVPDTEATEPSGTVDASPQAPAGDAGAASPASPPADPASSAPSELSSGAPAPPPVATGGPGHPARRPALPPTSNGKPPADPGARSITQPGDAGTGS